MSVEKLANIREKIKRIKIEYLIVIALAAVALIIVLNAFPKTEQTSSDVSEVRSYVSDLETKLEKSLKQVKGAGNVSVIISVSSSSEQVYATEKVIETSGRSVESPVLVSGKPVLIKESYPEIMGVVVVADGAKTLSVKVDLLNACKVFLSIDESKIKILST